jgi:hypothetical protein
MTMGKHENVPDTRYSRVTVEGMLNRLTEKQRKRRYIPNYLKPKVRFDRISQFPYRCPICWSKYILPEKAEECLERCWAAFPDAVFEHMDRMKDEPKEIGSWQWDLDEDHSTYCGVVDYDRGPQRFFSNTRGFLEQISLEDLRGILETSEVVYLWQRGENPLPPEIERFADVPERPVDEGKRPFAQYILGE